MAGGIVIALVLLGSGPQVLTTALPHDDRLTAAPAPASDDGDARRASDMISAFRLIPRTTHAGPDHRVPIVPSDQVDLVPGDRGVDIGAGEQSQRRREPGAAVDAHMSMRLDDGLQGAPAFGIGGIGGALLRVTDALTGG